MYKDIIIEALNNESKRDKIFKKTYYKPLMEKITNMSEKESKRLVSEAKVNESIGSWLTLMTTKDDECSKKCQGAHIIYYKRRLCLLKCRLPIYERSLAGLKREAAKEIKVNPASRQRYEQAILKLENKISKIKLMIHRYETSGELKNIFINADRDWTS